MKKLFSALLLMIFLSIFNGCGVVNDMKGMFEKQEKVKAYIKETYGLESQVGWNVNNGVLTQVSIVFKAEEVRGKTVLELENTARQAVASSFESTPRVLNVQIVCRAENAKTVEK